MCAFFANAPATTEIYTLSLHDALPIYRLAGDGSVLREVFGRPQASDRLHARRDRSRELPGVERPRTFGREDLQRRSEEHTSELQSRRDLVCRLLLEKKKRHKSRHAATS